MSTDGAPPGADPQIADITVYAPWGNLATSYEDRGYAPGLILLGRVDTGLDHLAVLDGEVLIETRTQRA